ncbi:MAG: hypothetical protein WBM86_14155 [Waterburya sp.]
MSTLVISDLSFLKELDNQESKIAGAASAGASAGADYNDAVAASGSTTRGSVYARGEGSYYSSYYSRDRYGNYYSSSYSRGPSASVDVYSYY